MLEDLREQVTDIMFTGKPDLLVRHQLDSYNAFVGGGIQQVFREKNPIRIMKEQDANTGIFANNCQLYLGGKDGSRVYFGRPVVADNDANKLLYPNIARLRDMTYATTVHLDVEAVFSINGEDEKTVVLPKVFLGKIPIMLLSDLCLLKGLAPAVRGEFGECADEKGGYFIVDGSEKVIISQEKFADNMLYVRKMSDEKYTFAADVRSVSTNASKPTRVASVRLVAPSSCSTNKQIVVVIANLRKPIPLFILMRALGIVSDKQIIEMCLLDLEEYKSYVDLFRPSVHDAVPIFTQVAALKYIASFAKHKTIAYAMEILSDYFLPHMGELEFRKKAYYVGHMVRELLKVSVGDAKPTDRDSFLYKRVDLPGGLLTDLFKEYVTLQYKSIYQRIDKEYTYKTQLYKDNFTSLIEKNVSMIFAERIVEEGFRKAFKGNWGAQAATKKLGIVQTLNRLSFNSALSHLRKLNLPFDSGAKITGPRLLHSSQWGLVDPIDTPDGGNVGLHKHLAIATEVSVPCDASGLIAWALRNGMQSPADHTPSVVARHIKVFVNGAWIGIVEDVIEFVSRLRTARRIGITAATTSISWYIEAGEVQIYTDGGRLCRPLYWVPNEGNGGVYNDKLIGRIKSGEATWAELLGSDGLCTEGDAIKEYGTNDTGLLEQKGGIIEMIDTNEEENALIAFDEKGITERTTHVEVDPSYLLGVMGNQVVFPENNPLPRDLFACGQMRQAVSLYHSNYQNRIDKMGVVLNDGQIPLTKSRYLKHISNNKHPYGVNVICAIMCYGGYNVEDSILFNQGSLQRGMFRTTYYNSYSAREEHDTSARGEESRIGPIDGAEVVGKKQGYDYTALGETGLIAEGTPLTDKTVLIGKRVFQEGNEPDTDASVVTKRGQKGYVDKTVLTEGEEGARIAKVRVRDERVPAIGDKFCSRCGQKGTIGLVIPEQDMPYTARGIRPDIIINPHALPSRMTIGQLVETLMGKACLDLGGFADCTAFANKGQKATRFGEVLSTLGYASTGNELLYDGETGQALETSIFIGPTYYMRLKHMVKDKINYRARGPRTLLTRQTVQGRANEGGLRIGEMERDGVAAHGIMHFLQESMLVRGDEYYMAVCNKTGSIAVYNEAYDLFLSPYADGPIQFEGTVDGGLNVVNVSKFGRSFSILRVPYAFKLLMQELSTMNVQMRLITADTVNYLDDFTKNSLNLDFDERSKPVEEGAFKEEEKVVEDVDKVGEEAEGAVEQGAKDTRESIADTIAAAYNAAVKDMGFTVGQAEKQENEVSPTGEIIVEASGDSQIERPQVADMTTEMPEQSALATGEQVSPVEVLEPNSALPNTAEANETGANDLAQGFSEVAEMVTEALATEPTDKKKVTVRKEDLLTEN